MAAFPSGSAWAMARDIGEGFLMVTELTYRRLTSPELDKLSFELDRLLRELRGEQPDLGDTLKVQKRNRRIQRINGAQIMLRAFRHKSKR